MLRKENGVSLNILRELIFSWGRHEMFMGESIVCKFILNVDSFVPIILDMREVEP